IGLVADEVDHRDGGVEAAEDAVVAELVVEVRGLAQAAHHVGGADPPRVADDALALPGADLDLWAGEPEVGDGTADQLQSLGDVEQAALQRIDAYGYVHHVEGGERLLDDVQVAPGDRIEGPCVKGPGTLG